MTISEHLIENAITRIEYGSEEFMQDPLLIEQSKEVGISMTDLWYITQYIRYVYRPDIECKTRDRCELTKKDEIIKRLKQRIKELEDKDWYEGTIKQLEEQNDRLIKERDELKSRLKALMEDKK